MNMQKVKKTFRLNEKDRKKLIKKIIQLYKKEYVISEKKAILCLRLFFFWNCCL